MKNILRYLVGMLITAFIVLPSVAFGNSEINSTKPSVACKVHWDERNSYAKAIQEKRGQEAYNKSQIKYHTNELLNKNCNCMYYKQFKQN